MDFFIILLLIIIIIKLFFMSEDLNEIKAALSAATDKVAKVAADVTRLHEMIEAAGELPTPEEWQEVKDLAAGLNTQLQAVDDQTAE